MRAEPMLRGYDGMLYRLLRLVTEFVYLNLLWLLACIPVVTAPAATAALFAVVREWTKGRQPPIAPSFLRFMRENARRSLAVAAVGIVVGAILAADLLLARAIEPGGIVLSGALLVVAMVALSAAAYAFPVMANYDAPWQTVVRNACLFALAYPLVTVGCVSLLATAAVIVLVAPIAVAVAGSTTAWGVYRLCDRAFAAAERRKGDRPRCA